MPVSPVPDREQVLARMATIIAQSVARKDTKHPVFHGCYDWHSAVHGHWALLRIARVTGRHQDEAGAVEKSLSRKGIAEEAQFLRLHPRFELPYGRAWFLRLAVEFELWAAPTNNADSKRLRAMADDLAESLLAHYKTRAPSPLDAEYENSSWALVQLHAYTLHSQNDRFRERAESLIHAHMLKPARAPSFQEDSASPAFFSRFGNWAYLIAKTQNAEAVFAFLQDHPLPEEVMQPVRLLPGAHHLGMNWSRAWALRALSRVAPNSATRRLLEKAYLDHVAAGIRQHAAYAGNFMAYDHWVPQFAVYAITE